MKRVLLATTMLVAGGSMAYADITLSGYGRFGLDYHNNGVVGASKTQVASRLRLNIDATTETDTGVTFGIRTRIQHNQGDDGDVGAAPAKFFVEYEGLRVEVGNVDTPYDSVALTYDGEMGFMDRAYGDSYSAFYTFNSRENPGATGDGTGVVGSGNDYVGVAATYSIADVNLYAAFVNPEQTVKDHTPNVDDEISIAADWTDGQFAVAASYVSDAAGVDGDDLFFLGGAYTFDEATVGLNFYNHSNTGAATGDSVLQGLKSRQFTLYGNYNFGDVTGRAYISHLKLRNKTGGEHNPGTAYGIGADYALGAGSRLSGSIERGFKGTKIDGGVAKRETRADIGVRFDF